MSLKENSRNTAQAGSSAFRRSAKPIIERHITRAP